VGESVWDLPVRNLSAQKAGSGNPHFDSTQSVRVRTQWSVAMKPLFLFSATLLSSFASFSQAATHDEPLELEEFVVTAALVPVVIDEIAGSLTVITRQEIEQSQARFLSDLLRDVPGFAVSQSGGQGSQTQVRVRGSEANHVLVMVDGVRVNDPASSDEFQYQYALGSDIERVEIMRGPQSATWGTDALSAVINIILKKSTDARQFSITAEGGSFDTRTAHLNAAGYTQSGRFWAGLSHLESDGINISRSGSERDGVENLTFNVGGEFSIGTAVSLSLAGRFVDASSEFDEIDFLVSGLPADADRVTDADRSYLQAALRFNPAESAWSGDVSIAHTATDNQNFADGVWTGSTSATTRQAKARAGVILGDSALRNHRLTFALDRQEIDFSQRGEASFFGDPNQDQSYDVTGYAIEYRATPFDRFNWSASARRDQFSDFSDVSTWQVSASRQLNDGIRIWGSMGTGSKAPTFTERYGFYEDSFIGNPGLRPETSSGWELGLESKVLGGRGALQLAYFDQDLEDEIDGFVFNPSSGLFTAENKPNSSQRKGLELQFDMRVTEALTWKLGYTYVDASEVDIYGNQVREVRRPENQAHLVANYQFAADRANLNFKLVYTGSQLDLFFSPETFLSRQVVLPSHVVVDLAGSWRLNQSLEWIVRVSNLLDEQYEEVLGFARPGTAVYAGLRGRLDF